MKSTFALYILRTITPKLRSERLKILQNIDMGGGLFDQNWQRIVAEYFLPMYIES